jgi:carbonic anhydrase
LNEVTHAGDSVTVAEPVSFHKLLPFTTRRIFRYHGSLTTPPCSEIVTLTVFRYPIHLTGQQVTNNDNIQFKSIKVHSSDLQLDQFRQLTNDEGNPLINNDRPVQPINNREIDYGV